MHSPPIHVEPTPGGVTVFTLTEAGCRLAERLTTALPGLHHVHKPQPFIESVQATFTSGRACVFICATGIVIRALAPVLHNKHVDPAVVVLDEKGQFVIPLLSGHEGGGGALAFKLATVLDADCVVTSHTDYSRPVYALGMGCDRSCPLTELESLYTQVLDKFDTQAPLAALASIELKRDEPALQAFSEQLQVPFVVYSAGQLRQFEDQLSVRSDIVFREVGCYGVAEAAALCAASRATGAPAELVVSKRKNKRATIAVARSYLPAP